MMHPMAPPPSIPSPPNANVALNYRGVSDDVSQHVRNAVLVIAVVIVHYAIVTSIVVCKRDGSGHPQPVSLRYDAVSRSYASENLDRVKSRGRGSRRAPLVQSVFRRTIVAGMGARSSRTSVP